MKSKIVYQVSFVVNGDFADELFPKVLRLEIKKKCRPFYIVGPMKVAWGFDIDPRKMGQVRNMNGRIETYVYPEGLADAKKKVISVSRKYLRAETVNLTAKITDYRKRLGVLNSRGIKWIKEP